MSKHLPLILFGLGIFLLLTRRNATEAIAKFAQPPESLLNQPAFRIQS